MVAVIACATGGEQGVSQGMQCNVGIRMAGKGLFMGNEDATQRDPVAGDELMDIIAVSATDIGDHGASEPFIGEGRYRASPSI